MKYRELINYYVFHINNDIPVLVYCGLLFAFMAGVVLLLVRKGIKDGFDLFKL